MTPSASRTGFGVAAVSAAADYVSRQQPWDFASQPSIPPDRGGTAPSAESEALAQVADGEVMRALVELPAAFRTPVYLADVHGYRCREIAEMLGIPVGTVMSRLHRGRATLRLRLAAFA